MKKLLLVFAAAAGLSGCAVYPSPGNEVYGGAAPYVVEQPVYIQGGVSYGSYPRPYVYPRGYYGGYRGHPGFGPRHGSRPNAHPLHPGRGARDRDRDGIPNRFDRDRDGDGVRNRHDRQPNNPRRR